MNTTGVVSAGQRQYLKKRRKKKFLILCLQIAIFLLLVAAWEITTRVGMLDSFIFSSPSRLLACFRELSKSGTIYTHLLVTVTETCISFALVMLIGVAAAVLLWWFPSVAKVLEPYLVVLNSLPKSALAPIFIVWLGNNMKTIIVAAVSVAVFGAIMTLTESFRQTEAEKIKLIYTLGGTKKDVLFKVVLPGNIPTLLNAMKVNMGLSLVGVIIGEFLAANAGLGYLVIYGSQVFKLDLVLLSIVLLCILATALYCLLSGMQRLYEKRH